MVNSLGSEVTPVLFTRFVTLGELLNLSRLPSPLKWNQ